MTIIESQKGGQHGQLLKYRQTDDDYNTGSQKDRPGLKKNGHKCKKEEKEKEMRVRRQVKHKENRSE